MDGRQISVGVFSSESVNFTLLDDALLCASCRGESVSKVLPLYGEGKVLYRDGRIDFQGELYDELEFSPLHPCPEDVFAEAFFTLEDVTIGVDFHWERRERQRFAGSLKFIVENGKLTVINRIGIEDYLRSVISSEMKATASAEFLKAHAVISRSWLLAQMERRLHCEKGRHDFIENRDTVVRWADREDHRNFDVCADDHCQRYQGLTRTELFSSSASSTVEKAVESTRGEILSYEGKVCDARFSKCCGGMTESFGTCWEDAQYPYLRPVKDAPDGGEPFCNTSDISVLSQVLNDYDLETGDFYSWKVEYDRTFLAELVKRRSGMDLGDRILALEPLKRGASGRIYLLKLVGSSRTVSIGKELTIRKWLSESHLKSSAFDVAYSGEKIILNGRGWGHGVGLCQIGAAVMGSRGYTYREILYHYFPGTELAIIRK